MIGFHSECHLTLMRRRDEWTVDHPWEEQPAEETVIDPSGRPNR